MLAVPQGEPLVPLPTQVVQNLITLLTKLGALPTRTQEELTLFLTWGEVVLDLYGVEAPSLTQTKALQIPSDLSTNYT